jgi:hypothetical protein
MKNRGKLSILSWNGGAEAGVTLIRCSLRIGRTLSAKNRETAATTQNSNALISLLFIFS